MGRAGLIGANHAVDARLPGAAVADRAAVHDPVALEHGAEVVGAADLELAASRRWLREQHERHPFARVKDRTEVVALGFRTLRVNTMRSWWGLLVLWVACTSHDDLVVDRARCEQLRTHLVDLRLADLAHTVTTSSYQYKNPQFSPDDRGIWGFRGFDEVRTTRPSAHS